MSEAETDSRQEAVAELDPAKQDAAATVAQAFMDDFTGRPNDNVEDTSAQVAEPAQAPEVVRPIEFSPELPDDLARELDEAEIDEQVERELAARQPDEDDEYAVVEDEDQMRERVRLAKRNEYLERELAKTKATSWKDEALKYFPLSKHKLDDINATSRRSFLRQAKAEHKAILPYVQEYLAQAKTVVDEEKTAARTEGKKAAALAYGQPLSGPDVNEIDATAADAAISKAREEARKSGNLAGLFRTMIASGK